MFDTIVITAANAAQAKGYRAQVAALEGVLAPRILVVPDPGGRRVGSLGSTVNVLRLLARKGLAGKGRVLVCHSGGDSKRLPSYAALGKAFVPVPQADGSAPSLFEVIVRNMEKLRLPKRGLLVVCGDVAPRFDFASCDFARPGVTGVAYYDSPEEGSRHGVYVPAGSGRGAAAGARDVAGFLQKPDLAAAKAAGAVRRGRVAVDTGILWIDPATCAKMLAAGWRTGDIYEAFPKWLLAGGAPFGVNVAPSCEFFHVGSTRELLQLLGGGREWVEACGIPRSEMKLAGRNVVTWVPRSYGPVELAEGECLTCLPVDGTWIPVRYRVEDDFKSDGKWEALGLGGLMKRVRHADLLALRAAAARADETVVRRPLRIDLAGGWSDTPPICNEMGGRVLNMAVTLEGAKPVEARVRRIAAREVRVESADLGRSCVLASERDWLGPKDPHDWCALVKSALAVTGVRLAGGGLDIRISADVPKGSGLGTSSILGAALVEALLKARAGGADVPWQRVSDLTLALEREMGTGGGWQDQMGALVPGVKLVSSRPGPEQAISVRRLPARAEAAFAAFLEERALLYFTGRKRMARNILRGVLDFYAQNPCGIAHETVDRLKDDAAAAFKALAAGDWDAFCAALNGYWLAKKALDPGSTNALVETIVARIAPWTAAVSLCGAGGGGFLFAVARSRAAKARMRAVLEAYPPVRSGRFYAFGLAR